MRIVVDINHPGHVHYFKNFIMEMEKRGHEILITASHKDVSTQLLQGYGMDFVDLGSYGSSPLMKMLNIPKMDLKMYQAVREFRPDMMVGFSSIRVAHVSKLLGCSALVFDDTEHAKWEHRLYVPFADVILTPSSFKKDLGLKQVRFDGYMELAALHPNRFIPDPTVLKEIGMDIGDPFIIVRFVAFTAGHDVGQSGIRDRIGLVRALEKYAKVLITSEGALPLELQSNQIKIAPDKLHDLLYFAKLYIGEGGTTANEAAVLGTPAIIVSTMAKYCGNHDDLSRYQLLWTSSNDEDSLEIASQLLSDPDLKSKGQERRQWLLSEKVDVTSFMVSFVERYSLGLRSGAKPQPLTIASSGGNQ